MSEWKKADFENSDMFKFLNTLKGHLEQQRDGYKQILNSFNEALAESKLNSQEEKEEN